MFSTLLKGLEAIQELNENPSLSNRISLANKIRKAKNAYQEIQQTQESSVKNLKKIDNNPDLQKLQDTSIYSCFQYINRTYSEILEKSQSIISYKLLGKNRIN